VTPDDLRRYKPGSTADYEATRLLLHLAIWRAQLGRGDEREVDRLLERLSAIFSGESAVRRIGDPDQGRTPRTVFTLPLDYQKNRERYRLARHILGNRISTGLPPSHRVVASPLSFPYVVTPTGRFLWCSVANRPEDTITPRSSTAGRVVHPILASEEGFSVCAAGDVSFIATSGGRIVLLTSCSGHYRPESLSPGDLWTLVSDEIRRGEYDGAVLVTRQGGARFGVITTRVNSGGQW
jgi:hypothetical protein